MNIVKLFILLALPALIISSCKKEYTPAPAAPVEIPVLGNPYQGGYVFYLDNTGKHGYLAAVSDQKTAAEWGCEGTMVSGTDSAVGTGAQNTSAIQNGCSTSGIAARMCSGYIPSNGIGGWFLPSKAELELMYTNLYKNGIGGFTDSYYWCSTEDNANNAWFKYFGTNFNSKAGKSHQFYVRPMRLF